MLNEIMITLFNNSDGMTLSVTPNHSQGGKRINFSFKGKNTKNTIKAYNDGIAAISNPDLKLYFENNREIFRKKVKTVKEAGFDCWLSKGYLSEGTIKGKTVPAVAFMFYDSQQQNWMLNLQLDTVKYECDLDSSEITERQEQQGAIAGHRWRKGADSTDYDNSFMGKQ